LRFRLSDLNPKITNLFTVYTENLDSLFTFKWVHLIWCSGPHQNVLRVRENQWVLFLHCSLTYTYCWLFLFPPPPSISSSFLNSWVPFVFLYTHSDIKKVSIFLTWLFHILFDVSPLLIFCWKICEFFFFFFVEGWFLVVGDVGFRDKFGYNCYWIWHECHFHCVCLY